MLADIEQSIVVVEIERRRAGELVVDVEKFLSVVQVDAENFDAVVGAVSDPDVPPGVHDERPRLVEVLDVSARRRTVTGDHLLALAVNETDAVRRRRR